MIGLVVGNCGPAGRTASTSIRRRSTARPSPATPSRPKRPESVDFLLNIIPDTFVGAFAQGDILQVLLIAILFGFA